MKTVLNILIAASILVIMSDCEANANRTALNYSNSILAAAGLMISGFLRLYVNEFITFLNKPQ
ncbi:hypothetical protein [Chryseobacterium lathyri]|uniref:hypothetical protein n=1 Tax=Chryseobacterium lathyri TaxID=395933 RepID=UPI001CBE80F2|nr:hypothetical protein [Chryseobacterium lathyri]